MSNSISSQLAEALHARRLIRFKRRFEDTTIGGYVIGIGPRFFLLALVSDRIWFDGFECFRMADVKNLRQDPYKKFVEAALKKRSEKIPFKVRLDLSNISKLLESASRIFPLLAIHRELIDPGVCWIGRVLRVDRESVWLLEIGPDAIWEEVPSEHRLKEITQVNFAGDYENALYLVGGEPPATSLTSTALSR
ncbi:MAG TPA: hypothetical protein VGK24_15685 [Candidatus Angelobacter sp.]|jgi:hypothetical protein